MDDLISRRTAINEFYKYPNIHWTTLDILAKIDELPSVKSEQKHGRWIDETFEPHGLVFYPFRCDQCGEHNSIPSDYCPSCGADMRGEAK